MRRPRPSGDTDPPHWMKVPCKRCKYINQVNVTAKEWSFSMWAFELDTDEGVARYPEDKPYVMRDQAARTSDRTIELVLWDIHDVLMADGKEEVAAKAKELAEEAKRLPWDGDWTDYEIDPDASEKLRWILEEAEQLEHVYVDWDGDAGVVRITISDYWEHEEEV